VAEPLAARVVNREGEKNNAHPAGLGEDRIVRMGSSKTEPEARMIQKCNQSSCHSSGYGEIRSP
jgi:hypothetical protein